MEHFRRKFKSITAVLCTYNSENRIINTLHQLCSQVFNSNLISFDVVLVNNGSTDNTAEVVKSFLSSVACSIPFDVIDEPKPGKGNALETGYSKAKGDLILTVDDDNWLHNNFIRSVVEIFNELPDDAGLLGAYGIPILSIRPIPEIFIKNQACFACADFSNAHLQENPNWSMGWAAGSVFPRKIWQLLNSSGFEFFNSKGYGKAYGEDSELFSLIRLLGYRQFIDSRCWFYHDLQRHEITNEFINDIRLLGGRAKVASYLIDELYHQIKLGINLPSFEFIAERLITKFKKMPKRISAYGLYAVTFKGKRIPTKDAILMYTRTRSESVKELNERWDLYKIYYQKILEVYLQVQQKNN